MRPLAVAALLATALGAEGPVRVAFTCTENDIQSFGLTCSPDEPCPVYLELSAAEAVGGRLILTGNLHTGSTTLYSILLASEDGGKTWTEPYARQRATVLEQIQFFDFEAGWIAGELVEPTPKDPFLLVTTDGGKTWRRVPVFEDGRLGGIGQFWFDSRSSGLLVIDRAGGRHELYESMTGGESWTVKEVRSSPIRLKDRSKESQAWRVRAHAASKTYRVERRPGEKWETVASFVIHIADCK